MRLSDKKVIAFVSDDFEDLELCMVSGSAFKRRRGDCPSCR